MENKSKSDSMQESTSKDNFSSNFEETKKRMLKSISAPVFDEIEKLKQEIEFKTRALKQKESEAVQSQLESLEQTKKHYRELLR